MAEADTLTLVAGGDVEWSRMTRAPGVLFEDFYVELGAWLPVPYVNTPVSRAHLVAKGAARSTQPNAHDLDVISVQLGDMSGVELMRHPLSQVAKVFQAADLGFVNLEMPLSDRARLSGDFRGSPEFADALRWAGIHVVSTANNHALDAEGQGLEDTLRALKQAGVVSIGAGSNLQAARRPFLFRRGTISLGLLAYNQIIGMSSGRIDAMFATDDRSGVAPLDPLVIQEDIERLRSAVDFVVLSFHWGAENTAGTHFSARRLARAAIDAGADVILGHHSHVPQGVERYGKGIILYSLGNLVFGHGHSYWTDNIIASIVFEKTRISSVELVPIAGTGIEVTQPTVVSGDRARVVLESVRVRSAALGTQIHQLNGRARVAL